MKGRPVSQTRAFQPRVAPRGTQRLGREPAFWLAVLFAIALAGFCVLLARRVGDRQARLATLATWQTSVEAERRWVEGIVESMQTAEGPSRFLGTVGARDVARLGAPALLANSPLLYSAHRETLESWARRSKEAANELMRLRQALEGGGGAGVELGLPYDDVERAASTLAHSLEAVVSSAARQTAHRAIELGESRSLLDAIAWIAILATALFGVLLVRARRHRQERDASAEALHAFEERYRQMFQQIDVPKLLVDPVVGQVVDANPAACTFYGGDLDELRALHAANFYSMNSSSAGSQLRMPLAAGASTTLAQHRLLSGEVRDVEVHSAPIRVGYRTLLYSIVRDVTERQRSEAMVRESESRFRTLAENVPGATYLCRNDGDRFTMIYLNSQIVNLVGVRAEAFLSERARLHELYHPSDAAAVLAEVEDALRQRRPYFLGYRLRHVDGTYRWVEEHGQGVYDETGGLRYLQGTLFDVTGRRRAQEALAAEKDRLGVTVRSIADAVISTSTAGIVELMNAAAETLLGVAAREAVGAPLAKFWCAVDAATGVVGGEPPLQSWLAASHSSMASQPVLFRRTDGGESLVSVAGSPIRSLEGRTVGAVVVLRDVTEQQRREEQMQRAAKLESIGVLAGGIAHDFNNILAGVIGNLSLARLDLDPDGEAAYSIKQAQDAAVRAQNLTRQLLTFAKGGAPLRRLTNLEATFRETVAFALHGSNVRCEPVIALDLAAAEVDEGQINQVLHNLVLNAVQAMPEGGTLEVEARNVLVDGGMGLSVAPGPYIEVRVTDEGCGIPEEAQRRIFDPYFTTKRQGTGLGLATSYSIVRKHDGCIALESTLGVGTTFRVYLPASDARPALRTEDPMLPRTAPDLGAGRVLLMDDEKTVRDVCGRMLQAMGLTPTCAVDGQQAVDCYKTAMECGERFDVVIMDLTVPGAMGGREAMKHLLDMDADACVIVSSGYSNDPILAAPEKYGFRSMLRKPYTQQDLAQVLHDLARQGTEAGAVRDGRSHVGGDS